MYSPNTNNTNNAYYLNTNGNVNNNNCTNTNGSRPALMVRSDQVSPKPKAAPSITSKEVIPSLAHARQIHCADASRLSRTGGGLPGLS